jgi:multisubunit Na+/H+ antiporter MnhE subunit
MQTPISLIHDIIVSSFVMAYKIVTNKKTKPYLSYQQVKGRSELGISLIANAITITPATIALEADANQITIHNFD